MPPGIGTNDWSTMPSRTSPTPPRWISVCQPIKVAAVRKGCIKCKSPNPVCARRPADILPLAYLDVHSAGQGRQISKALRNFTDLIGPLRCPHRRNFDVEETQVLR